MAKTASLREAYGRTLLELGRKYPDIVALDADLSHSTMTHFFASEFPDRFFNCGVAEQNMIGLAAGLAASGKIPFASTFAVFAPGRCFDQLRVSVAQPHLNVKIVMTHSGITVGEDGMSHQAIEDLALACSLVGFTVLVPSDAIETARAVTAAATTTGPFYIRLCRPESLLIHDESYKFLLGRAEQLRHGTQATIIAMGLMVAPALEAADRLKLDGIDCRVLNMATLRPLDAQSIVNAAVDTGAIVTVEEHLEHGGLGSSVAQVVVRTRPVPMEFVALKSYGESGKPAELLEKYGLTAKNIEHAVRSVLLRKNT
ncbi:MAG: transketolase C-terminal domain-containing protein [Dehalococcoidia bacterium]|nr:transketolase C-terminal domain-containing protein [Dehalococcoidia bacterium]